MLTPITRLIALLALSLSYQVTVVAEDLSTEASIAAKIQVAIPQLPITTVSASQIEGFYEVELANGERLFANAKADHFIAGDMFQINDLGLVNLSEAKRDKNRADKIAALKDEDKIIFSPKNKKATVTVFTDVDCGYCRKLHTHMAGYLARGIEIQYLAFPRAGIGSNSYNKIVSAWCAKDKQDALTRLKNGEVVASASCENPVADQYRLGSELGVTGTPALVLESGKIYPGYIEPDQLARVLGI